MQGWEPTQSVACLSPRPLQTAGHRGQAAVRIWKLRNFWPQGTGLVSDKLCLRSFSPLLTGL